MDEVKTRSAAREYHPVDVNKLSEAEQEIIRHIQKEAFTEEISKLKNITTDYETLKEDDSRSRIQKPKGASPLSHLDPYLDNSNLVRIGGRLKQATTSCKIVETLPLKNTFSSFQCPPYLGFKPFPLPLPSPPFNVDCLSSQNFLSC